MFNIAFPQHMATFAEQIGNYDMALKYASLRYTYTGDVYDLARCVEDAILAGDDESVVNFGNQFFARDDSDEALESLEEESGINYAFVFGSGLSGALYSTGDFAGALSLAEELNGGPYTFEYGCPLMSLAAEVVGRGDAANSAAMAGALNGLQLSDEDQAADRDELVERLNALN